MPLSVDKMLDFLYPPLPVQRKEINLDPPTYTQDLQDLQRPPLDTPANSENGKMLDSIGASDHQTAHNWEPGLIETQPTHDDIAKTIKESEEEELGHSRPEEQNARLPFDDTSDQPLQPLQSVYQQQEQVNFGENPIDISPTVNTDLPVLHVQDSVEPLHRQQELEKSSKFDHCPSQQSGTIVGVSVASDTADDSREKATNQTVTVVSDISGLQEPSSSTVSIRRNDRLLEFLRNDCAEAMKRSKHKVDIGPIQDSHWTTGNDATIAYQARIDSGAFGVVFQVIQTLFSSAR